MSTGSGGAHTKLRTVSGGGGGSGTGGGSGGGGGGGSGGGGGGRRRERKSGAGDSASQNDYLKSAQVRRVAVGTSATAATPAASAEFELPIPTIPGGFIKGDAVVSLIDYDFPAGMGSIHHGSHAVVEGPSTSKNAFSDSRVQLRFDTGIVANLHLSQFQKSSASSAKLAGGYLSGEVVYSIATLG
jgi:hypothetical protein